MIATLMLLSFIPALLLAIISWKLIESPALQLGKKEYSLQRVRQFFVIGSKTT
jgi:peptidoglycan/LPS O-acetylase OafA/YrhL